MQDLIDQIEHAFADVAYPGDDDLTNSTYGEEPAALIKEFRGKRDRTQLTSAFLNQAPDGWATALSFFSARALRFYLPVYLVADIRGELEMPDPISRMCSFLTPLGEKKKIPKRWGGGTMGDRARETFGQFNDAQVAACVAYLKWKLDSTGGNDLTIEHALENYWLKR